MREPEIPLADLGKEAAYRDLDEVSSWVGEYHELSAAGKEVLGLGIENAFDLDRLLVLINSGTPAGQAVIRLIEEEKEERRRLLWLGLNPGL
jgi:hypothetical protein